ncbi:hypothetical protein [Lacticaseibacillus suihuaensis]
MNSWLVLHVFATDDQITLPELKALFTSWFPLDADWIHATLDIAQPSWDGQRPYLITTLTTPEMPDLDVALYNMTQGAPLEYEILAEYEWIGEDEEEEDGSNSEAGDDSGTAD